MQPLANLTEIDKEVDEEQKELDAAGALEEQTNQDEEDQSRQFQTKTSYVMQLKSGLYYNISLDTVMRQH